MRERAWEIGKGDVNRGERVRMTWGKWDIVMGN